MSRDNDKVLNIYQENNLIKSVDLSTVDTPYEIPVTYDNHTNILRIYPDGAEMIYADCPDKLCVNQGKIINSLQPIVCLPNKVMAEIVSKDKNQADIISH